jgi:carbon-monoxide dehydrogenase large subunit
MSAFTGTAVAGTADALAHLSVRHIDIPITPEKVWRILKEKGVAE